jgi:hypothetical protein
LEGKPDEKRRWAPDISIQLGMLGHLNVSGKDGDQEGDEPNACDASGLGNQHADSAEALADAADRNQQRGIRQIIRHDPAIQIGVDEVIGARRDKE